jgi:hypothetical protein
MTMKRKRATATATATATALATQRVRLDQAGEGAAVGLQRGERPRRRLIAETLEGQVGVRVREGGYPSRKEGMIGRI